MSDRTLAHYADILRNDFVAFAERAYRELYPGKEFEANWHIEVIAAKLEAVRRGEITRLIINVPPRSLKSFLGSVTFPAFLLGHQPSAEVLCTSYVQAVANDFGLPCRTLMLSPFYQALFGTRLSDDRQAVEEFKTTAGGVRRAVSWNGAVLSRGADFLIIDDPISPDDANSEAARKKLNDSFHGSIATRLNRDTGAIVLIMQRLHANDLTDFIQKSEQWDVLAIPAIAESDETYAIRTPYGTRTIRRLEGKALQPHRQSLQYLNERRVAQGGRTFDAQYQQRPHRTERAIIQREWLAWYDEKTKPAEFDTVLQSWDTAIKPGEDSSYNVCTTWGIRENQYYLLHVFRDRMGFRELKLMAIGLYRDHMPNTILIEEQSSGSPLEAELSQMGIPTELVPAGSASKAERLYACSNSFESGRVRLPTEASWLDQYVDELTTFPDSDFDDQVDSTSQALRWDVSNSSATRAVHAMRLLAGEIPRGGQTGDMIQLEVLEGGGVIQFADDSGRPDIPVPGAGEYLTIDRKTGIRLAQTQWKKFRIVPE